MHGMTARSRQGTQTQRCIQRTMFVSRLDCYVYLSLLNETVGQ